MRHGLAPVERLLSIFRQVGKRSVLFRLQRIFDEISHFERQRDAISLSPAAEPFVDRLFQDDVDARIGCRQGVLFSGFTCEKKCNTCDGPRQGRSGGKLARYPALGRTPVLVPLRPLSEQTFSLFSFSQPLLKLQ